MSREKNKAYNDRSPPLSNKENIMLKKTIVAIATAIGALFVTGVVVNRVRSEA